MSYCGGCSSQRTSHSGSWWRVDQETLDTCWLTSPTSRHLSQSAVTQSCPTLCDPTDCSRPGFPVHHQLLEHVQTHAYGVGDAIQPSHPLSSTSPPPFGLESGRHPGEGAHPLKLQRTSWKHHHSDPSGAQWKLFKARVGGGHFRHCWWWLLACQVASVLSYSLQP